MTGSADFSRTPHHARRDPRRRPGLVNVIGNLLGIAAPIVTGAVFGLTGSFAGAFLVTGVVLLAGIGCYTVVLGRIEKMVPPPPVIR